MKGTTREEERCVLTAAAVVCTAFFAPCLPAVLAVARAPLGAVFFLAVPEEAGLFLAVFFLVSVAVPSFLGMMSTI